MRKRSGGLAGGRRPSVRGDRDRVVLAIGQRRNAVIETIRSARKRLLISVFRCTDVPVLDAIGEACKRGVEVRMLLTPRARGWQERLQELRAYVESMGVKVHSYSDPVVKYHAKYIVADDGPALIASLNMTAKCFTATCDFLLVTRDRGVVTGLQSLFETDWQAPESSFDPGTTRRLIVGPDRAREQLTGLIEGARRSISIIDHKLSDVGILALLKAKKAAGVHVRVLGAKQIGGLLSHGKLVIVDGKAAAFGSMALSPLSLDFHREVAVIADDPRSLRKLKEFFRFLDSGGRVLEPGVAERFVRSYYE